jgi:hypothetical protein
MGCCFPTDAARLSASRFLRCASNTAVLPPFCLPQIPLRAIMGLRGLSRVVPHGQTKSVRSVPHCEQRNRNSVSGTSPRPASPAGQRRPGAGMTCRTPAPARSRCAASFGCRQVAGHRQSIASASWPQIRIGGREGQLAKTEPGSPEARFGRPFMPAAGGARPLTRSRW